MVFGIAGATVYQILVCYFTVHEHYGRESRE